MQKHKMFLLLFSNEIKIVKHYNSTLTRRQRVIN